MLDDYFRQYGLITIFALIAVAIPVGMLLVSTTLSIVGIRPDKPDEVKKSIYECGFETLSKRWSGFNSRFYAIALVFVVFDVEVVFLFPWSSEFGYMASKFGAFVLIEMAIFVAILLVGWLYAYRKGDLEWT